MGWHPPPPMSCSASLTTLPQGSQVEVDELMLALAGDGSTHRVSHLLRVNAITNWISLIPRDQGRSHPAAPSMPRTLSGTPVVLSTRLAHCMPPHDLYLCLLFNLFTHFLFIIYLILYIYIFIAYCIYLLFIFFCICV